MGRFKIGDKVVLSEKAFRDAEGSLWISEVCEFLIKNKFLTVVDTSSASSRCYIEEFPQYIFEESWLVPYIDCEPSPMYLDALHRRPLMFLPEDELSVRDRFAMAALMCFRADLFTAPEYVAEKAYKVADAMMEVRNGNTVQQ